MNKSLAMLFSFFYFQTTEMRYHISISSTKLQSVSFSIKFRILKQYKYPKISDPVSPKKNLLGPLL